VIDRTRDIIIDGHVGIIPRSLARHAVLHVETDNGRSERRELPGAGVADPGFICAPTDLLGGRFRAGFSKAIAKRVSRPIDYALKRGEIDRWNG
jgi:hypothetical protein